MLVYVPIYYFEDSDDPEIHEEAIEGVFSTKELALNTPVFFFDGYQNWERKRIEMYELNTFYGDEEDACYSPVK